MIRFEAQVTGCQCTCDHCLTYGHKSNFNMSMKDVEHILKNVKDYSEEGFFFPLYDVTNHPEFIDILKLSHSYDFKRNLLSTNGVHDFTLEEFQSLKDLGIVDIQLAFHGMGRTHDSFVHYKGAYKRLLDLIDSAGDFGFKFWNILFVHKENSHEIEKLIEELKKMKFIRNEDVGINTYMYMGRAMKLKHLQFTQEEFNSISFKEQIKPQRRFTESQWLEMVKEEQWNKPAFIYDNSNLDLHIDRNLNVYFKDYNPYYFNGLANSEEGFKLGNLNNETLTEIIKRTDNERPPFIKTLEEITIPEMASEVGKRENILYTFNDVPQYKWTYDYIKANINCR